MYIYVSDFLRYIESYILIFYVWYDRQADKSTIVDEAVSSIKSLEQTLQKLEMQKLEKLQYSSASTNTTPTTTFAYAPSSSSSPTALLTPISNHPIDATATDSYPRAAFLADQVSSSSAAAANLPYPCNDPIVNFDTWSSRNVVLTICGNEAFFNLCVPKHKPGVFTSVCYLFEKYNMEVLFANVSSNVFWSTYVIQAQVSYTYNHFYHMICGDIYYLPWFFFFMWWNR